MNFIDDALDEALTAVDAYVAEPSEATRAAARDALHRAVKRLVRVYALGYGVES